MIWDWLVQHQGLFLWLSIGSLILFLSSLALIPFLVIKMESDHFVNKRRLFPRPKSMFIAVCSRVSKNLLGCILFFSGIVMLFVPGQGLLTMLLGLGLIDFPGKRRLERELVRLSFVNRSLNWIRQKYGKRPLIIP